MVSPLVEHMGLERVDARRHHVLADDRHVKAGDQLVDAVVDLGVDMIGSAGEDKNLFALLFGLGNDLVTLAAHLFHVVIIFVIRLFGGDAHLVERQIGEVERQPLICLFGEVLGTVDTKVFLDKVHLADVLHIILDDLGIVRDHRTVVVVVAEVFVKVVGQARIKNILDAVVDQLLHMPVHQLCREADGVAGDRLLTALIELARGRRRMVHLKFQLCKEAVPERIQLVHIQSHGNAELTAQPLHRLIAVDQLQFVFVYIQL